MIVNKLPTRLKLLRRSKGLTQKQLAQQLNLSPSTIALYESGNRTPDPDMLQKIADFYDVSMDYLLGRVDYWNPSLARMIKILNNPDIRIVVCAGEALTPEQLELWIKIGNTLFPEAFNLSCREVASLQGEDEGQLC